MSSLVALGLINLGYSKDCSLTVFSARSGGSYGSENVAASSSPRD